MNKTYNLTGKDVSRSAHVTRWHSVGVHRNQSVAEHSALTAFYTEMILLKVNPSVTTEEHLTALRYSLWHDQPEVVTGDLCTPLKRLLENYFSGASPLEELEKIICSQYKELSTKIEGTYLKNVTKLADFLDAIVFLEEEGKEKHAQTIKQKIITHFNKLVIQSSKSYPEHQWESAKDVFDEVLNSEPLQIDEMPLDFFEKFKE